MIGLWTRRRDFRFDSKYSICKWHRLDLAKPNVPLFDLGGFLFLSVTDRHCCMKLLSFIWLVFSSCLQVELVYLHIPSHNDPSWNWKECNWHRAWAVDWQRPQKISLGESPMTSNVRKMGGNVQWGAYVNSQWCHSRCDPRGISGRLATLITVTTLAILDAQNAYSNSVEYLWDPPFETSHWLLLFYYILPLEILE